MPRSSSKTNGFKCLESTLSFYYLQLWLDMASLNSKVIEENSELLQNVYVFISRIVFMIYCYDCDYVLLLF